MNWYNFAAVFVLIAQDFNQNVSGLGVAVGAFYLGAGLFQIPAGLLAAKIGPRRTAVFGTLLASGAAILTSLSTNFSQLPLLRFLVGVGMAFVFGPGVILMARYFREKAEGFSIGLFNAAYYLGGALGLFGWAVLADAWGWRASLALSGGIGLLTGLLTILLVPRDTIREEFSMELTEIRRILSHRWLIILGTGMFGITGLTSLLTGFMVYYMEDFLKSSPALAGFVGALAMLGSLISSPIFGMLYDRTRNASGLIFICGICGIIGLEVASIPNIYGAVLASLIVGLTAGGALTVGFSTARELAHAEYETLAVSFINSTQLFAGFLFPPIFSISAVEFGYSTAWALSGLYMFPFIAILLFTRSKRFISNEN